MRGDTTISGKAARGSLRSLIPIGGKNAFEEKRMLYSHTLQLADLLITFFAAKANNAEELVFSAPKKSTVKKYMWIMSKSEGSVCAH